MQPCDSFVLFAIWKYISFWYYATPTPFASSQVFFLSSFAHTKWVHEVTWNTEQPEYQQFCVMQCDTRTTLPCNRNSIFLYNGENFAPKKKKTHNSNAIFSSASASACLFHFVLYKYFVTVSWCISFSNLYWLHFAYSDQKCGQQIVHNVHALQLPHRCLQHRLLHTTMTNNINQSKEKSVLLCQRSGRLIFWTIFACYVHLWVQLWNCSYSKFFSRKISIFFHRFRVLSSKWWNSLLKFPLEQKIFMLKLI